jgi:signal transduction histidine kinase
VNRVRGHQVAVLLGMLALVCLIVLPVPSDRWLVPLQVACIMFALFLCLPLWPVRVPFPVAAAACAVVGADLAWDAVSGLDAAEELTELPLLAALTAVIVRYAHSAMSRRERDFVRSTSHQLRTPLTVALSHAELIQRSLISGAVPRDTCQHGDGDTLQDDVAIVVEELKRLSSLSNRLLLMDIEQSPTSLDDVDVSGLVVGTIKRWQSTVVRRWVASVSAHGTVPGNEEQLSIALDSLVENALKATTEGDQITISAHVEGSDVVIAVSDTGCGIADASRKRLFDRHRRTGKRQAGTGLGLAIVKAIVERHGGLLDVESGPGEGTTFSLRIGGFRPTAPRSPGEPTPSEKPLVHRDMRDLVA